MLILVEVMEPFKVVKKMELLCSNKRAMDVSDKTFLVSTYYVMICRDGSKVATKLPITISWGSHRSARPPEDPVVSIVVAFKMFQSFLAI